MSFSTTEILEEFQKSTKKVRAGNGGCVTKSMIEKQLGFHTPAKFVEVRRLGNFVLRKPIEIMAKRISKF